MAMNRSADQSVVIEKPVELDVFSEYYAELLDGTYDCVDRVVLNAYFGLAQSAGGLRYWWRKLKGSDEGLDNAHLMRFAGRFSRRVRAYAQKHGIPLLDCKSGERKHLVAAAQLPADPEFVGVFAILTWRARAPVWDVKTSKSGKIVNIARKYTYVKHYAFHIMDPDWGHIVIVLSPHPPFVAQIILNGHEYVACQARQAGITFSKEGNCFVDVSDATALAKIADTLRSPDMIGHLEQLCERWIYSSCLCFALSLDEQAHSGFRYSYSDYQLEYSRNLIFKHGSQMEDLVKRVIERVWPTLDLRRIKTIFGAKQRPYRRRGKKQPRVEVVIERPAYNLTVLKIHFGKLTVKIYTKGERVLRVEVIIHNARALPCGCSLPKLPQIIEHLSAILNRFLQVVHCVHRAFISDDTLDQLPLPAYVGRTRVGGIDLNQARLRAVLQAVLDLASSPQGFKVADVAARVRAILGIAPEAYSARQAAYDIRKLRGKNLVYKLERSRRYRVSPEGLRKMTALLVLREKVIRPLLAGVDTSTDEQQPRNLHPIDAQYEALQHQMRKLFELVGIAA